jgi:hypothetical protein
MPQFPALYMSEEYAFWLTIYAITMTVLALAGVIALISRSHTARRMVWDMYSEYIDIAEFSNRNIPLRVTYKGTEPRWLWATYLSLSNMGRLDITSGDTPDRRHFIIGAEGCRYIGFNRLISEKAKVTLSPLFKGNDVFCKIEFDRLGPGDEILTSLLFVADERRELTLEGALFGADSHIVSGHRQRMLAWRSLWWLLICVIASGAIGGLIFLRQSLYHHQIVFYQLQLLLGIYFLALGGAALLLRPIRRWQQIPERFHEATGSAPGRWWRMVRFMLGLSDES